ncbi:hypothetical protein HGRIS_003084 [Hohenbuehelia grisea]|uniref:WSC domain-containing protein n=1 Tax=Hohenbuehelia grisea TaxID=104357 RepID=A0ABR3JNN2_9AGAR
MMFMTSAVLALTAFSLSVLATECASNSAWEPQGCFFDSPGRARTLSGASYVDSHNMTIETCVAFCQNGGYNYAGVEFGQECYCDHALQLEGKQTTSSDCNIPCSGNSDQICGAGDHLNIFYSGNPEPTSPRKVDTWKYAGCYVDNPASDLRVLERNVAIPAGVTVEYCTKACKSAGFQVAGMEFGTECWCAHTFDADQAQETDCHMACAGDHREYCGAPDRLTIYRDSSSNTPSQPQTCEATSLAGFLPRAVFKGAQKEPTEIMLVEVIDSTWSILSACESCLSHFETYDLRDGSIAPVCHEAVPVAFNANAGESPSFLLDGSSSPTFHGYCVMANSAGGPKLLGVDGHSDLWSLCPNSTADGRLDLVYAPKANHAHYTLDDCEAVDIELQT